MLFGCCAALCGQWKEGPWRRLEEQMGGSSRWIHFQAVENSRKPLCQVKATGCELMARLAGAQEMFQLNTRGALPV